MKRILVGVERNVGTISPEGEKRKIDFDNMLLHLVDYNERDAVGFSFKAIGRDGKINKGVRLKIKTVDFKSVTGISPVVFIENFEKKYMFRQVQMLGMQNDYGEFDITTLKFSKKRCFELYADELAELESQKAKAKDISADFEGDDESDDEFDDFDFDVSTGEILEKTDSEE